MLGNETGGKSRGRGGRVPVRPQADLPGNGGRRARAGAGVVCMNDMIVDTARQPARLVTPQGTPLVGAYLIGEVRPDLVRDELLAEIFAATVKAAPHSRAMTEGDRTLTYAEVDAEANAVARGLLREGVRPGDVVGLWMPRGLNPLVAQIAVAKTGAAWLPFDADAPVDRIAVCLVDCEAKALLTSPYYLEKLEGHVHTRVLTMAGLADGADKTMSTPARSARRRPTPPT